MWRVEALSVKATKIPEKKSERNTGQRKLRIKIGLPFEGVRKIVHKIVPVGLFYISNKQAGVTLKF